MPVKFPEFLVAVDIKRKRVFVLAKPHLIAVKRDDVWYYGETITDEEIEHNYELLTDKRLIDSWIEEARAELKLP